MKPEKTRILFIDDDVLAGNLIQRHFDELGYACKVFAAARPGLDYFAEHGADCIITDLRMPEMSGFELIQSIRELDKEVLLLVITGYSTVENAVEAMKLGANDFIKKPFDIDELHLLIQRDLESVRLRRENEMLKQQIQGRRDLFGMIGHTPAMKRLFEQIKKIAEVSCHVIIQGESGTGKELVARALHDYSPRREQPFVVIDCGALTESLLESELFGYEKGAFTGASQRKRGLMEQASGGTLFLDEIGNISDAMQTKLMRAIDNQTVNRVGGTQPIAIDVRVIAASNRSLEAMVESGEFRHDFYHRLNVVSVEVPSLAQRREDIPGLIECFIKEFSQRYQRKVTGFDSSSMQALLESEWPGNVRQLKNLVERCVILAEGEILHWNQSDEQIVSNPLDSSRLDSQDVVSLEKMEQDYIRYVLKMVAGKKLEAARILGIDKTTLWRKLRKLEELEGKNGD